MADRIQQRRDTAARWVQYNPILLEGEVGYVLDNPNQYKIGDGIHAWNDLPVRGGGTITNLADDEDIQSKENDLGVSVLKFADRRYDAVNFSGKGYKILRKNIQDGKNLLTQEMINEANTIYEVRYDFDLRGEEITIPEGCVLKFEGGSLRNGIINGNNYSIVCEKSYRIFYTIQFKGDSVFNLILNIEWLCDTYMTQFNFDADNYTDSSTELNEAFSCGVRNFIMPYDKFFYLKNPIIINGDIDIIGNEKRDKIQHRDYNEVITQIEPCIVTKEIDTMFIYHFNTDRQKKTLELSGLKFANFSLFPTEVVDGVTYSIPEKYNTPIVRFINESNVPLIRPRFDLVIVGKPGTNCYGLKYDDELGELVIDKRVKGAIYQYTGISLEGPMYFTELNGYMQDIFQGFRLLNNTVLDKNKNGFNCFRLNADFWTILGGDFNHCGNPILINGFYQSGGCFHTDQYNKPENAYFRNCSSTGKRNFRVNMQGFIYDLGLDLGNDIHITNSAFDTVNVFYPLNTEHIASVKEELINTTRYAPIDKTELTSLNNLLNTMFYIARFVKSYKHVLKFHEDDGSVSEEDAIIFVDDAIYTSDYANKYPESDKILHITTEDSYHLLVRLNSTRFYVQNVYKLFTNSLPCKGGIGDYDSSYFYIKPEDVNAKRTVEQSVEFILNELGDSSFVMVYMNGVATSSSIKPITVTVDNETITQKIDSANFYGDSAIKVPISRQELCTCTVATMSSYITPLLRVYIPSNFNTMNVMYASSKDDMKDRAYGTYFGFNLFSKRPIYKLHSSIYDFDGEAFDIRRKGIKNYRPGAYGAAPNNVGFQYYDESLKRFIYWQGEKYIDYDGESVDNKRAGTSDERPTGINVGFQYFDTNLGKPIYWTGSKWVDATGTEV